MSSTTFVTCARGWSPDCLGSTELELHDDHDLGDPELPVVAVLASSWTLVEVEVDGEWVERPCCGECLTIVEASWLLAQRAEVERHMRGR